MVRIASFNIEHFDRQPEDKTKSVVIEASGRANWIGWVELATEHVDAKAIHMTAKVIDEVAADIIGVIEAEHRPSLVRFNRDILQQPYEHVMLVDGNDARGIDVGVMTKAGFRIETIVSNVDFKDASGIVFSRDCPQYEITTPNGNTVHVLLNHFKSQSGGGGDKRLRQAEAVRAFADSLFADGHHVIVMGDLNEGPKAGKTYAENLTPLYANSSPLVDAYSLTA